MSDSLSNRDSQSLAGRYLELIDQIVDTTLKGNIRSKEQVYQLLLQGVEPGTGEVFERSLSDRLSTMQQQIANQTDEMKLVKANRILRATQTIQGEWQRLQEQHQAAELLNSAVRQITTAEPTHRLSVFLKIIDPNRGQMTTLAQWQALAKALQQSHPQTPDPEIEQLVQGIRQGLESWQLLAEHLVSWMYDQSQGQLGFGSGAEDRGPWAVWAKRMIRPIPQSLFQAISREQSIAEWAAQQSQMELSAYVELALILQCLQQGLVGWFDKLVYDAKVGAKLSISTFLTFALIWSQLANGFQQVAGLTSSTASDYVNAAFQVTLQILRIFSQRSYFPLYGGIFASFSGRTLRDTLSYLDEPLRQTEGTQEKARILTLLGYSLRAQGRYEQAKEFHEQAIEIARVAGDRPCEIASFNHLSRLYINQKHYPEAINASQRALMLSRQTGDRLGEANALANLGYSEVFQAQQLEHADPEIYESAIRYLDQGLKLSEQLGDGQSRSLCLSSLGIAQLVLEQPQAAIAHLQGAIQAAQFSGDLYLQGLNLAYLAEAHYQLKQTESAIYSGCLGMYLLHQLNASQWRQSAGLLTILQGQIGEEAFQQKLKQSKPKIIAVIGVDGYDYLPELLAEYRRSQQ
ncbi:MAG: tetratricopeptide repeat protein [Leptolyngbyaceae bacterium]|nr:tetratricopeptide repeat protein [Leptolyngbyaceae bacterium]